MSLGAFDPLLLRQNEFSQTKAGRSERLGSLQGRRPSSASRGRNFLSLSLSLLTHRFLAGDVAEPRLIRLIRLPTRRQDGVDGGGW